MTSRLTRKQMLALAAPALPMSALTIPLVTFLPEYYANSIGLNLTVVGSVFMLVRLLDIGVDPFLGGLMDRTKTRWGRFKPWLVAGVPVIMIGTSFLLLAKPGVGPAYLFVWLLVTYLGFSIISLSQLALTSSLTRGYDERTTVFGWWQAAYTLGILSVVTLPSLLGPQLGNDRTTVMRSMAAVIVLATPLTILWTCFGVRDDGRADEKEKTNLADYFRLFKRRSTRILLTVDLLLGLSTGLVSVMGVMFFVSVKQLTLAEFGVQLIVAFSVAIGAAPLWAKFAGKIGKHRALALGALCNVSFYCLLAFIPPGAPYLVYLAAVLNGFGFAALNQLPRAMLADINDEELLDHGVDRNGLLYALLTGIYKIGQAVAVGIGFTALDLAGFVPSLGSQNTPHTLMNVVLMFVGLPSCLSLTAGLLALTYPLSAKRHAEIRRQLDERAVRA